MDRWIELGINPIGTGRSAFRTTAIFALALGLAAGAVGASLPGPVWAAEKNSSTFLDVLVSRGELTVDARNAPLAQVLQTVGQRAGIEVTLRGDFSTPITASLTGVPLEEGIRRLAHGHSVAVTYAASADAPRRETLTGVWVIEGSSTRTPSARPAPLGHRNGGSAEPRSSSLRDQEPEGKSPEATLHFPLGGWLSGMQALADEGDRGSEVAVALLTDISASEPAAVVRQQAVAALGRLRGPDVEPALTSALADDDALVRIRAVRGLRGTGTETAVQSLAGVLLGDADPEVRLAALSALTSFPGRTMLQGLAKAVTDPDGRVRDAAARGLAWWSARPSGAP